MPIKTPRELFVMFLTDVRQGAEKAETIYEEIGQLVQDPTDQRSVAGASVCFRQRPCHTRRVLQTSRRATRKTQWAATGNVD